MTNEEFISHERYLAATCSGYTPYGVEQLLDRLEAHLTKREDYWKETVADIIKIQEHSNKVVLKRGDK